MKKIFYLMVLFILLFSCKTEKEEVEVLRSYEVENSLPFMKYPFRVELADSFLVVMDLIPEEYAYHVVAYPGLEYLYSVGRRGNGPEEMVLTTPFRIRENKLFLLDGSKANLFTYLLGAEEAQPDIKHLELPTTLDFVSLNDSTVLVGDYLGESRLIRVAGSRKEGMFDVRSIDENYTKDKAYYWRSYMDYHPTIHKVVLAAQFGDLLEVYDIEEERGDFVVGKDGLPPIHETAIQGYFDVKWVGDKIYALYAGGSKDTYKEHLSGEEPRGADILRVFDQQLNCLNTYRLDKKINGFTVDTANHLLIGANPNSDNPLLFYRLNE